MRNMMLVLAVVFFSTFIHAGEEYFPKDITTESEAIRLIDKARDLLINAKANNDYQAIREIFEEYEGHAEQFAERFKNSLIYRDYVYGFVNFYVIVKNEHEKRASRSSDLFFSYRKNRIAADKEIKGKSIEVLVDYARIESLEKGHYALMIQDPDQRSNMAVVCIFTPEKADELAEYDPNTSIMGVQGTCRGLVDSKYIVFNDCSVVRHFR